MNDQPLPKSIGRTATAALAGIGITQLKQVAALSEKQLNQLHGVGPKAVSILRDEMAKQGYSFANEDSSKN